MGGLRVLLDSRSGQKHHIGSIIGTIAEMAVPNRLDSRYTLEFTGFDDLPTTENPRRFSKTLSNLLSPLRAVHIFVAQGGTKNCLLPPCRACVLSVPGLRVNVRIVVGRDVGRCGTFVGGWRSM